MLIEAERLVWFALPIIILYIIVRLLLIKIVRYNPMNDWLRFGFVCYLAALFYIVWIYGALPVDYLLYNWVPFKTILGYLNYNIPSIAVKNLVGNIAITIPLGLFAALGFRIPRLHIVVYAVGTSVFIEAAQFVFYQLGLGMRTIDIDDVLLNTCGTIMGYYAAIVAVPRRIRLRADVRRTA
ncbi:VanZ family protein [Paenibacillus xylaniclasticus]|uniref:VanZ family protein n=1 Tax=Paenibacillus xylaniclasticus TaxID=588083 RepID=UPI0013E00E93|nr:MULTISPECIES: VanZ family protein [Paenibacillus]GFN33793.1 hypothetical protein PCURB6_40530 [Paenibacillus curdlanolyticus]